MKHSHKRIIDLKKRASKPLVVQRSERMRNNILRLKKKSARSVVTKSSGKFELSRQGKKSSGDSIYLPFEKNHSKKTSRLKIVIASFIFVIALNVFGIFSSGKQAVDKTISDAFTGVSDLMAAAESFAAGDFDASQNRFAQALQILADTEKNLMVLSGAGVVLETQPEKVQTGSRLVSAGKLLASAGEHFAEAANEVSLAFKTWKVRQQAVAAGHSVESFSDQLSSPISHVISGIGELENASALLALIETDALPAELQEKVEQSIQELNYVLEIANPFVEALPHLPDLLGDQISRRYLLLFQNTDEIRPTGGFIGSIGILDIKDGFVKKFEIKNVYEIDGQIVQHLDPPEGFGFITGNWGLRDANYHPDFPTSAEAASFLFETAGFGSIDGVVAINSSLLTTIVELVNGVKLERFADQIEADDLTLLLSLVIETKIDGVEKPKQILTELWESLLRKLSQIPNRDLAQLALNAIAEKEIQFSSSNPDLFQIASSTGVANQLQETDGDYLFIVNTSLSGNKSDRFCDNQISHSTTISESGETTNELKILRKHDWSSSAERHMEAVAKNFGVSLPEELKEILGRGRNIDLIKVFVPLGSELIGVEGIPSERVETSESNGKTYFSFSLTTQPKFSREVVLRYTVPQTFTDTYSFLGEFQSGDSVRTIEKVVKKSDDQIFEGELNLGEKRFFNIRK